MEFRQIILISLQIMNVISKKKYVSSSDESIENLLYFKDCQRNKVEEPTTPLPKQRLVDRKPPAVECLNPKMCCTMTCGENECASSSPYYGATLVTNNMEQKLLPLEPMNSQRMQPPVQPQASMRPKKKKVKPPTRMPLPPAAFLGRRDAGSTKDRIKSLINKDDDIRKILKDLVRVTMQKVDLVDMIHTKKAEPQKAEYPPVVISNTRDDYDDDDDLE